MKEVMKPSTEGFLLLLLVKPSVTGALQVFKDISISEAIKKVVLMMTAKRASKSSMKRSLPLNYIQKSLLVCPYSRILIHKQQ